MDTKRRVGGLTISTAWIVGFGRELFVSRTPGDALAMLWEIISPQSFYLMLVVLGFGGLFYFGWPVASLVCPSVRFRARAALIHSAMLRLEKGDSYRDGGNEKAMLPSAKVPIRETKLALENLEIPCPSLDTGVFRWGEFLSKLLPHARKGNLKQARTIWPEMEEKRRKREAE